MEATYNSFKIDYTLFTNADPEADIQFGMDFVLIQQNGLALCQLIYPATAVGTNLPGQWNVDNHKAPGGPESLIFNGADNGTIRDTPRELTRRGLGVRTTVFGVFIVNVSENNINTNGVRFGYSIDSNEANSVTEFLGFTGFSMTPEQKTVVLAQSPNIKFVNF